MQPEGRALGCLISGHQLLRKGLEQSSIIHCLFVDRMNECMGISPYINEIGQGLADKLKASWKFQGEVAGQEKEETNSKAALRKVYLQPLDVDLHSQDLQRPQPRALGRLQSKEILPAPRDGAQGKWDRGAVQCALIVGGPQGRIAHHFLPFFVCFASS